MEHNSGKVKNRKETCDCLRNWTKVDIWQVGQSINSRKVGPNLEFWEIKFDFVILED